MGNRKRDTSNSQKKAAASSISTVSSDAAVISMSKCESLSNLEKESSQSSTEYNCPAPEMPEHDRTHSPPKKKLDKDGFVTPATPDIPKTSVHYESKDTSDDTGFALNTLGDRVPQEKVGYAELDQDATLKNQMVQSYQNSSDSISGGSVLETTQGLGPSSYFRQSNNDSGDTSGGQNLEQIFNNSCQENKSFQMNFMQIFVESEKFELFCPTRLDKLLEEAHALENNLLHQKEMFMERLHALSKTLQH